MRWLQLQTDRIWLKQLTGVSMLLIAVSILGSYSRGGLLALAAVALFLILKSRKRFALGILLVVAALSLLVVHAGQVARAHGLDRELPGGRLGDGPDRRMDLCVAASP